MNITNPLFVCHDYLMRMKFPYHSVSVIHRPQDLGFHVIFSNNVRDMVTDDVIKALTNLEFKYSINKQ